MLILGIDPGTATTGFGLVEQKRNQVTHISHGVIKTHPTKHAAQRLLEIRNDLIILLKKYKPDHCNIEKLFFHNNVKTAMRVAESRGVVLVTLEEFGIPHTEISPSQLKSNLTSDGTADKKQMQKMTTILLNLKSPPKPDDAADALALALFPSI